MKLLCSVINFEKAMASLFYAFLFFPFLLLSFWGSLADWCIEAFCAVATNLSIKESPLSISSSKCFILAILNLGCAPLNSCRWKYTIISRRWCCSYILHKTHSLSKAACSHVPGEPFSTTTKLVTLNIMVACHAVIRTYTCANENQCDPGIIIWVVHHKSQLQTSLCNLNLIFKLRI